MNKKVKLFYSISDDVGAASNDVESQINNFLQNNNNINVESWVALPMLERVIVMLYYTVTTS